AVDAALEHRLQRLVGGVAEIEAQIVAEQEAPARAARQTLKQAGQAVDVLAVDLDQRERVWALLVDPPVNCLDQRALAHAARAPQERVVGRPTGGEALRVVEQDVAYPLDP